MTDRADAPSITIHAGGIEFDRVSFAYEAGQPVLENFSLSLRPGEKVGIIGTSGQGKSTLTHLLLRYFHPQQGRIALDGRDIKTFRQEELRQQIAFIPQDTLLFHRTIRANVAYGQEDASQEMIYKACQKAAIHNFILSLPEQYATLVGERGIKLSGGQRQRIAIARAFLKKAPILILDEATSALDSNTEAEIQVSLARLIAERSMTVLAIAHRLSTLRFMDRIIVFQAGKITEQGTHEVLMKQKGYYYTHWQQQSRG